MNWQQLSQSTIEEVIAWASEQPWAEAMAGCQQDAEWHAEGDVWTHTKMVCRELPKLNTWPSLSPSDQTALLFTALLHDAGKPATTQRDPVTGRTHTPKHALKGERLARAVLRDLECDLEAREQIAHLVRYHGRPAFLVEKEHPAREVIWHSWLLRNELLYLFALADTRGRQTSSMTRPEDNVHLWKTVAEENDVFRDRYPFANDQARFLFYNRPSTDDLHYVPHEDYRCTVTMMSGLPGSGKDSWLARNRAELAVVSLDEVRGELDVDPTENQGSVVQAAKEKCRELLRAGQDLAFNATNLVRQTRRGWIRLFTDYGARVELVYVEPPLTRILDQNRRRDRPVPEQVIRALAQKCEPPTWAEAHGLVVVESF
ncbi:MAG: HD domain-containing protein [Planctomycetota bacterium]|nr:MAG: HD domain-containing protein [Planctomycetota bacterium]